MFLENGEVLVVSEKVVSLVNNKWETFLFSSLCLPTRPPKCGIQRQMFFTVLCLKTINTRLRFCAKIRAKNLPSDC